MHREKPSGPSRQHNIFRKMTVPRIFCAAPGNARLASGMAFGTGPFPLSAIAGQKGYS